MATSNVWRLTTAGRAALADGQNIGVRAVSFTRLGVGSGHAPEGAGNDALVALRAQTDTGALTGTTSVAGRIAAQATIVSTAAYDVTEVGLFARIGAGVEFLAAYWTDDGRVVAAASGIDDTLVLAGVLDIQAADADVTVTVTPSLTLNPPAGLAELLAGLSAAEYVRVAVAAGQSSLEGLTRTAVLSDLLDGLPTNAFVRIRTQAGGTQSFDGLTRAQLVADLLTGVGGDQFVRANAAGDGIEGAAGGLVRTWAQAATDTDTGFGQDWTTGIEVQVETMAGEAVVVLASPAVRHGGSGGASAFMRLRRDAVDLLETGNVSTAGSTAPLLRIDAPPAGQHTYRVQGKGGYDELFNADGRISTMLAIVLSAR